MKNDNAEKLVLLTEGYTEPVAAKTAVCVLRYRPRDVVAIFDRGRRGATSAELLGVGGKTPIIGDLGHARAANTLMIGIAPPGGRIPDAWREVLLDAIDRGMKIVSGLHQFLGDDPELAAAAERRGVAICDVRKNSERDVASRASFQQQCLRVLTVGQDCSIGKMVTAVELTRALRLRGQDAKFIATGQTGVMVEGEGCTIDSVVSDFVSGAVEKLVLAHQHHDVLVLEGQATISHPRYSCVATGLLHGARPQAMVMVYEPGRATFGGLDHVPLTPLPRLIEAYEGLAALAAPSRVVALAMNGRKLTATQAAEERRLARDTYGLPVADPIRDGCDELLDAILSFRESSPNAASPHRPAPP